MQRPFMLAFYLKSLQPLYGLSRSFVARLVVRSLARRPEIPYFALGRKIQSLAYSLARELRVRAKNITYVGYIALFRTK